MQTKPNSSNEIVILADKKQIHKIALKITLTYIIFGLLWILLSDKLVGSIFTNIKMLSIAQTIKGWFFIFISGWVIYLLVMTQLKIRQKTSMKLVSSQRQMDVMVKQTGLLVYKYDLKNRMITWSGAVKDVTGYSHEELKRSSLEEWALMIHEDDREEVLSKLAEAERQKALFRIEYRWLKKTKDFIFVEDFGYFLEDENGRAEKMIGFMKDITEHKLKEQKLSQYSTDLEVLVAERTKELEDKNEELQRFNKLFVGREFRIKELKEKLKANGLDYSIGTRES